MRNQLLASLLSLVCYQSGFAEEIILRSGNERIGLLELYTSEGCSSCPPADRWLSGLVDDPALWTRVVPVAFHVDYWDYLGWTDRFASAAASRRQREYAAQGGVRTVYTPGFVFNGHEWRRWHSDSWTGAPSPAAGKLRLEIAEQAFMARFESFSPDSPQIALTLALLGFGLQTEVAAGENAGHRLQHDFVVLATARQNLSRNGTAWTGSGQIPGATISAARTALAAWVHYPTRADPLQAVGGWLP